jgi:EAL domain-containing protein (putative c-di-GMP-specific phosphodiesterase class I)
VAQRALTRALKDHDQLVLLYQPIHDARTRVVHAAEALLRQRRESGEIREASIISETAEENGGPELFTLDQVLVKKAYTDGAKWQKAGFNDVLLHINLSPRELEEGDVADRLTALVTSCGIDTHKVNLGIVETHFIENPADAVEVLRAMKDLGVGVWLDDFGTGHSSLEHLMHFPLDGLKIPATFVKKLPADRRSSVITRGLLRMAHELGLQVVAEGVERQEQLDFLIEHGCESVQGFLLSRPMTVEQFQATLAGRSSTQ